MQPRDGGLEAVRRALAYLGRYPWEAVGAVLALLLVAAANLATPQLIRLAIDVGFTQAQPSALGEAVAGRALCRLTVARASASVAHQQGEPAPASCSTRRITWIR